MALPDEQQAQLDELNTLMREKPPGYENVAIPAIQKLFKEVGSQLPPNTRALLEIYLGRIARSRYPKDVVPGNFTTAYEILRNVPPEDVDPALLVESATFEATRKVAAGDTLRAKGVLNRTLQILFRMPMSPEMVKLNAHVQEALEALRAETRTR